MTSFATSIIPWIPWIYTYNDEGVLRQQRFKLKILLLSLKVIGGWSWLKNNNNNNNNKRNFEVENQYNELKFMNTRTFSHLVCSAFQRMVQGVANGFLRIFNSKAQLFYLSLFNTDIEVCIHIYSNYKVK